MGLGKCTGWPFHDLDPRSGLWHRLPKHCLSVRWSRYSHGYYLIRFWRSSVGNFYFGKFSLKNRLCFFKVKHTFGHISGMVRPIDVKRKGNASVGYVTLTFDITHDLNLDVARSNFEIAPRNCWSDWCEMKRKWVNMILGRLYDLALWPYPWPWPWNCNFKVKV